MNATEVLGIVIRTVGLIVTLFAGIGVFWGLLAIVGGGPGELAGSLFLSVPALLIGLYLLRGARGVVRFAFPKGPSGAE